MTFGLPQNDEAFSYYRPHEELSPYIAYYSITTPGASISSVSPLFIPDLGGSLIISRYKDGLGLEVWGPFNKLTGIERSAREVLTQYFVEFQPGGLSRLVYPNSNELLNQKIPIAEVDSEVHTALKGIFERDKLEPNEAVSFLDDFFLDLLANKRDAFESGRYILGILQGFTPSGMINDLSRETHYSARHINRYLSALAGVSGKNYMRIKRFNKAAQILKNSSYSIEQVATLLDYYDPAHFIHDFTELAGIPPSVYRKNVSNFYSESSKNL